MITLTVITGLSAIDVASDILHMLREGSVTVSKGIGPSTVTLTLTLPSFDDAELAEQIKKLLLDAGKSELKADESIPGVVSLQAIRMITCSGPSFTQLVVGATVNLAALSNSLDAVPDTFAIPTEKWSTLVPKKPRLPYVSGKDLKAYSARLPSGGYRRR